jgi:hypothetical protein
MTNKNKYSYMKIKTLYFNALVQNKAQIDEISLGEMLGLDEIETRSVISELLHENRIGYCPDNNYKYKPLKNKKI